MNLYINCSPNEMGEMLLSRLTEEYGAEVNKFYIKGNEYLKIMLMEKGGKLTRVLNQPRAIENCLDEEAMAGILSSNKIPYGNSSGETLIKTYELFVFDLRMISIKIKSAGKTKPLVKYVKESDSSRSVEIARKVIYLLGLDFGVVHLALTARRRFKVMSVDPAPTGREIDISCFFKRITAIYNLGNELLTSEEKLGADPEFMMLNSKNGRIISASNFFPRDGVVGCDNIRIPNRQSRPIAEIRPSPETNPLELMDNIKRALNNANRIASHRNVRWVAGSQPVGGYPIGGHIHFSNIKLNYAILRALDNYLGLPIFMMEVPNTAAKRRRKYGFLADYRLKDHGGFEYRTPGSWLVSQKVATAVICLAKIVTSRYLFLDHNYLNSADAQRAFYEGNQQFFRPAFFELWRRLEKTDMYNKYSEELQIIPYMIENNLNWDEKNDLRKSWRLVSAKKSNTGSGKPVRKNVQPRISQSRSSASTSTSTSVNVSAPSSGSPSVNKSKTVNKSLGKKTRIGSTNKDKATKGSPGYNYTGHISAGRIVISNEFRMI